jgi:hypothetical protein
MRLRELFEAPATAVMAFGRMNPPTIGHAKLVDAIKSQPGDPFIFLSQSQKPKTDPLAFEDKLRYAKFFFPNVTIGNPEVKTIIQALQKVESLGYQQLIYVAGSDRVQAFEELLNKYNGKDFTFKSIKVVSAGERDPDADGAEGMSASKMRQAAADNDIESFKQGVPEPKLADEMFAAVRQGMGVMDAVPAEGIEESENTIVPQKIKPIKMSQPPKAPDATIPRSRDGHTKSDGTIYKQDKYNDNIMHVSNGGGTYTFDGARLIKWKTPKIKGYSQIHDFIKSTITVDANTSVTTKNPDFGQSPADAELLKKNGIDLSTSTSVVDTNAVYDLKGNLIDKGEMGIRSGGLGVSQSEKNFKINYNVSPNLSMHIVADRKPVTPKVKQSMDAIVKSPNKDGTVSDLIKIPMMAKKAGAKVIFKNSQGQSVPYDQAIAMMKKGKP